MTANSQVLQLQEKIRLQKELLAIQGSQLPPGGSTALVPFGYQQNMAAGTSQCLSVFQATPGAANNLLPAIQAMVAQAMLQGGQTPIAPSGPTNMVAPPNKYISQKTMVSISWTMSSSASGSNNAYYNVWVHQADVLCHGVQNVLYPCSASDLAMCFSY